MKINDKVIMLDASKGGHCFLVKDDALALIDTGLPFVRKKLFAELESLGVSPTDIKNILLTHHDSDHIGNLYALQQATGAIVWAHEKDIPYITGEIPRPGKKKYIAKLLLKQRVGGIRPYDKTMRVGNIHIIETPGHTPGHVCMLHNKVLFTGDLVERKKGRIVAYPAGWNWNTQMLEESVTSLKQVDYEWLCMAHSKPCRQRIEP
ncbi:MAG: MBL fold metallo-hydrolase [Christensenella sp.]|uniref:MBL fold metallo-hydrolase n=1 Tax=Christensenella sp. TaxID=1935934 RepID=UPI002B21FE77|nr:MBL fold metallo-hydrolase [Christensenella sp.]MEA5002232.1 MBL fold metallo-hydrolase [Christensenella sp.]